MKQEKRGHQDGIRTGEEIFNRKRLCRQDY